MNKKILLVILLAVVFALSFAFVILNKKTISPAIIEPSQQTIEEKTLNSEPVKIDDKLQPIEKTTPVNNSVKPVAKQVKKVSVSKPLAGETHTPLAEEDSKAGADNPVQSDIYLDETSKDIVITTEYKMASPAKYSFK